MLIQTIRLIITKKPSKQNEINKFDEKLLIIILQKTKTVFFSPFSKKKKLV